MGRSTHEAEGMEENRDDDKKGFDEEEGTIDRRFEKTSHGDQNKGQNIEEAYTQQRVYGWAG